MNTTPNDAEPRGADYWEADLCPLDPDNFWIDRATGERVNAATGERTAAAKETP